MATKFAFKIFVVNFSHISSQTPGDWATSPDGGAAKGAARREPKLPSGAGQWRRVAPPACGTEERQRREGHQVHGHRVTGLCHVPGAVCLPFSRNWHSDSSWFLTLRRDHMCLFRLWVAVSRDRPWPPRTKASNTACWRAARSRQPRQQRICWLHTGVYL